MNDKCLHNCDTCGSSCNTEQKENKDIFARIEKLVGELDKDEIQTMLGKISEELEKEGF